MSRRRRWAVGCVVALAVAALSAATLVSRGMSGGTRTAMSGTGDSTSVTPAGTVGRFAYLAAQHSNNCSLQAQTLLGYPDGMRLQGACCSPMDVGRYEMQVAAVRQYRSEALIPPDPYDVPVALAKQLLRYGQVLTLTPAQQATYEQAMRLSPEKGPCCCHCWRWDTFAGLSRYLIVERHRPAATVGRLIGDLDGCGGGKESSDTPHMPGTSPTR